MELRAFVYLLVVCVGAAVAAPGTDVEATRLFDAYQLSGDPSAHAAALEVQASDRRLAELDRQAQMLSTAPAAAAVERLSAAYAVELTQRDRTLAPLAGLLAPAAAPAPSGSVVGLDDAMFDEVAVKLGMRDPAAFRARIGGGVYLLAPYRPDRDVVVVVHGMSGSPTNFREIIGALDPARYQVWMAYYPSGDALKSSARLVDDALAELVARYAPRRLVVITHSLGGVVWRTRAMPGVAPRAASVDQRVATIYTLCALHHGVHFAPLVAVRLACHVLYRFLPRYMDDILDGSPFLVALNKMPPPPALRRTAGGYGHKGLWYRNLVGALIPGPDDGLVPLASTEWAGAVEHRTYDEDHVTMLAAPAVLAQLTAWLAADKDRMPR